MNGCNEVLEAKLAERDERAKKLYRYVTEVARRIDEATAASHSLRDLFSTRIEVQRQKLRDNCEKLLFLNPLNYGKKALELLWRKVYYETVSVAKKLRESDNEEDSFLFTHIICGIGQFHHLITRIQSEIKTQFQELDYMALHKDDDIEEINNFLQVNESDFGQSALHSCLIYLGDLSRYQSEIFHTYETSIAARYYLQAAHINTSLGMPYNQLGNLYLDKNYNLDSVCYYIHCLSCLTPFEGAIDNLTKIFEKNSQFCETLNSSQSLTQTEHIQNTVANFLSLIEIWYLNKSHDGISQRCNNIVHGLKIAMDFCKNPLPDINKNYNEYVQAIEEENINPSYLNANLVHKMVQICLFTLTKMVEVDEQQAFACKAFTLALLSQLLQKLFIQLESVGLKNPAYKLYKSEFSTPRSTEPIKIQEQNESVNESATNILLTNGIKNNNENLANDVVSDGDNKKTQNGDAKNNGKKTKRRRRRRVASSESSDTSDVDTETSEVETDESTFDEESKGSIYNSEDDSKSELSFGDGSDNEDTKENSIGNSFNTNKCDTVNGDSVKAINNEENQEKSEHICKQQELNVQEIQNFLLGDNFLASIKLLQDWVLTEKELILSCGESGEPLFQCVVDLLNIFSFYFNMKNNNLIKNSECKVLDYAKRLAKKLKFEYKIVPLPEDVNLRGTNICKFDKDAAEWQILDKYKPSVYEENIIRILNFIDFGNQIAKIVPRIRFNRTMKIFYLKKILHPKLTTKVNHKKSREWHNSKTKHAESGEGGLLRRLGRLWLASQVRELERSGQLAAPAFLALDAAALHTHLRRVKQLLRTRNFILLVPAVVLQELDDLKRDRITARDAIRWLEVQLKSGSRFLRAQRPGQSKPLPLLKYPRKAPPHVHNFIQILEFCNHFIADEKQMQGGNGDPDNSLHGKSAPLLVLLIGNDNSDEEKQYKEFSVMGAAQSAGISVEYIIDFYTKWRQTAHKSGKKR